MEKSGRDGLANESGVPDIRTDRALSAAIAAARLDCFVGTGVRRGGSSGSGDSLKRFDIDGSVGVGFAKGSAGCGGLGLGVVGAWSDKCLGGDG